MYERMLIKEEEPAVADLAAYCGPSAGWFTQLNDWLTQTYGTAQKTVFPYGNQYGWGITHRRGKRLLCNVFAEKGAFTVMLRLSNRQFDAVYGKLRPDTKACIDAKYPCGDGGWIQYRVLRRENLEDIQTLLTEKCAPHRT